MLDCPIDFAKKYLVQQISFGQGAGTEEGFDWAEKIAVSWHSGGGAYGSSAGRNCSK